MIEFFRKQEKPPHQKIPHFEKLNFLGVNWTAQITKFGYKYIFHEVEKLEDKYFLLHSSLNKKVLLSTLHYNEDQKSGFLHPDTDQKTNFDDVFKAIKNKIPDFDNLILSSCYPTYAKKNAKNSKNFKKVILLGNNDREYSVMYYPKENTVEIIPRKTSIENPHKS